MTAFFKFPNLRKKQTTETMGDKSPKSKQKNQVQKKSKADTASKSKQKDIASKQVDRSGGGPPKKK